MQTTDPIADMLTRIRNASHARHSSVDVPFSKIKNSIAEILLKERYVDSVNVIKGDAQGVIRISLRYLSKKRRVLSGLRRVSKPGVRVYASRDTLPRFLKGLGVAIISTSKGVMTSKDAKKQNVGGEILALVW